MIRQQDQISRLKEWKISAGFSYADLADITGCSERALKSYFNGDRGLSLDIACVLADAFGKSLDELVGRTPNDLCPSPREVV